MYKVHVKLKFNTTKSCEKSTEGEQNMTGNTCKSLVVNVNHSSLSSMDPWRHL